MAAEATSLLLWLVLAWSASVSIGDRLSHRLRLDELHPSDCAHDLHHQQQQQHRGDNFVLELRSSEHPSADWRLAPGVQTAEVAKQIRPHRAQRQHHVHREFQLPAPAANQKRIVEITPPPYSGINQTNETETDNADKFVTHDDQIRHSDDGFPKEDHTGQASCDNCLAIPLVSFVGERRLSGYIIPHRRLTESLHTGTSEPLRGTGLTDHHHNYRMSDALYTHRGHPYPAPIDSLTGAAAHEPIVENPLQPHSDAVCPMTSPLTVCEHIGSYPTDIIVQKVESARRQLGQSGLFNIDSLFSDERSYSSEPFEGPATNANSTTNSDTPTHRDFLQGYWSTNHGQHHGGSRDSREAAAERFHRALALDVEDEFLNLVEQRAVHLQGPSASLHPDRFAGPEPRATKQLRRIFAFGGQPDERLESYRSGNKPTETGAAEDKYQLTHDDGREHYQPQHQLPYRGDRRRARASDGVTNSSRLRLNEDRWSGSARGDDEPDGGVGRNAFRGISDSDSFAVSSPKTSTVAAPIYEHRPAITVARQVRSGGSRRDHDRNAIIAETGVTGGASNSSTTNKSRSPSLVVRAARRSSESEPLSTFAIETRSTPASVAGTNSERSVTDLGAKVNRSRRQVSIVRVDARSGNVRQSPERAAGTPTTPRPSSTLTTLPPTGTTAGSQPAAAADPTPSTNDPDGGSSGVGGGGGGGGSGLGNSGTTAGDVSISSGAGEELARLPEPICRAKSIYISPKAALCLWTEYITERATGRSRHYTHLWAPLMLNDKKQWRYVVNAPERNPQIRQIIRVDICENPFGSCSDQVALPLGFTSQCKQKYSKKKLLALDPRNGLLEIDTFFIPSCCVCQLIPSR